MTPETELRKMLKVAGKAARTHSETLEYLESVEKALARSIKARELLRISAQGWSDLHEKVAKQLATVTDARDATIKRLTARLLDVSARRDDFLQEITALHLEDTQRKDCDECGGTGTTEDTVLANYPSRLDPMTPAEETVTVTCEECLGTKKEWGV